MQNSASIQPRTSLSKFAKNEPKVRIKVRKNIGIHYACLNADIPLDRALENVVMSFAGCPSSSKKPIIVKIDNLPNMSIHFQGQT